MNDLAQTQVGTQMDAHALSPALGLPRLPDSFPQSPLAAAFRQPLMLGLFLRIQAGGWTVFVSSPTGTAFETAIADLPAHVARVKDAARKAGRKVRTLINPLVVCRSTDAEAYADAIVAQSEPTGVTAGKFDSDAHAWRNRKTYDGARERGLGGGNIQIIGSPQRVAESLVRLHAAGIDGVQLSFYDFQPDLEFFGAQVLPLLIETGLRL